MAFTIDDFQDLLRLLEQHPEWRSELRRQLLTDELLSLPQAVAELALAQRRTEERLETLTTQVERMVEVLTRMATDVDRLKGSDLEQRYQRRAHAYFSRLVRRAHALSGDELNEMVDTALEQGRLSLVEAQSLLQTDVVVRGQWLDTQEDVYLAVEVSWGVGLNDVARATERAGLLRRMGLTARPVVAGYWVIPEAQQMARATGVWQITDGLLVAPEVSG